MEEDDDLEESDDDDDVVMPEGPAPNADMSDSDDSENDIPMPLGPPPPRNVPPLPKGKLFIPDTTYSYYFYEKARHLRYKHYPLRHLYL
jgi:hypothetical protein